MAIHSTLRVARKAVFFLTDNRRVGSDATDEATKDGNLEYKSDEAHLYLCLMSRIPGLLHCGAELAINSQHTT